MPQVLDGHAGVYERNFVQVWHRNLLNAHPTFRLDSHTY